MKGKKFRPLRSDFLIFVLRKSFFLFFLRKFHLTSALIITLYHQTNIPIFTILPPPIWIYSHSDFFLSFFLGGKTKNTFRPLLIPMSNLYHQINIPIFALCSTTPANLNLFSFWFLSVLFSRWKNEKHFQALANTNEQPSKMVKLSTKQNVTFIWFYENLSCTIQ